LLETPRAVASLCGAFPEEDFFDDDEEFFEREMTYNLTQNVRSVAIGYPASPAILSSFTALEELIIHTTSAWEHNFLTEMYKELEEERLTDVVPIISTHSAEGFRARMQQAVALNPF
jgi:hypothetical protein